MKMKSSGLRKTKNGVALLLASVMLAALLTGCNFGTGYTGPTADHYSGAVMELTYLAPSDYRDAISPLTKSFNLNRSDIHVSVDYTDSNMLSGDGSSMWFSFAGVYSNYTAVSDRYDLTNYAEKNDWAGKFNSDALTLCEIQDQLAGYPTYITYGGVYYSKSIFEQYDLEVPEALEDMESICQTLKENYIYPLSLPSSALCFEQLVEYYAGAELYDQLLSRTANWNGDSVVSAFTTLRNWTTSDYLYTAADLVPLEEGQCAMALYIAKDVAVSNTLNTDEYGWFPFPNGTGRLPVYAEMVQLSADLSDAEVEACIEYLDYIYSDENSARYAGELPMPFATLDSENASADPFLPTIYKITERNGSFLHISEAVGNSAIDALERISAAFKSGTQTPEDAAELFQGYFY